MAAAKTKHDQELQQALSIANWKKAVQLCEQYELDSANEVSNQTLPNYGVHLFVYLLSNDLNNARFLWKRIPTQVKSSKAELAAIWKVGKSLWTKNYVEFYKNLHPLASNDAYKVLSLALLDNVRQQTFVLLSKAYTTLSLNDASSYLGLAPEELVQYCVNNGWQFDANTKLFAPKPVKSERFQSTGLNQLQQLTDYFVYLESS